MINEEYAKDALNVLVVEDDVDIGQVIEMMLREMGVQRITRVRDGEKALEEFKRGSDTYQIVVSDWEMPEMSGLELLKAVREIRPETLFMMVTVRASPDAILKAQKAGVTSYIGKPFTPLQLQQKMAQLIEILLERQKQENKRDNTHNI